MASINQRKTGNRSWYVRYTDHTGKRRTKSFGPGRKGERSAKEFAKQADAKPDILGNQDQHTWLELRKVYLEAAQADQRRATSIRAVSSTFDAFERICSPKLVTDLNTLNVLQFKSKRRLEPGKNSEFVSPYTVNKDLRYLKAIARFACRTCKWLDEVPDITLLRVDQHEPRFLEQEEFSKILSATGKMTSPKFAHVTSEEWWDALLLFLAMTGWRIQQTMDLGWEEVDFTAEAVVSLAGNAKGRRDIRTPLHPDVLHALEPLQRLKLVSGNRNQRVFYWPHHMRTLYDHFHKLQEHADIKPPYNHDGDGYQPYYGFHDIRRSFATWNAGNLDLFQLKALMQHKSIDTTRVYVAMADRRAADAVSKLTVIKKDEKQADVG